MMIQPSLMCHFHWINYGILWKSTSCRAMLYKFMFLKYFLVWYISISVTFQQRLQCNIVHHCFAEMMTRYMLNAVYVSGNEYETNLSWWVLQFNYGLTQRSEFMCVLLMKKRSTKQWTLNERGSQRQYRNSWNEKWVLQFMQKLKAMKWKPRFCLRGWIFIFV